MDCFDVAVVGLGHAGVEAALAAARLGARVVAVTQNPGRAGLMSCNPAIGGPGKSQLVREIDALGGAMGLAADNTAMQARLLNRSKGPAGWATRLQVDRMRYATTIQAMVAEAGLAIVRAEVVGIEHLGGVLTGLRLNGGECVRTRSAVLTTGTFLAARMHTGAAQQAGGRAGDGPSEGLSRELHALGIRLVRFKTGTPPRLAGHTVDWSACEEQPSEVGTVRSFSHRTTRFPLIPQRSSFVTRTTQRTHAIVAAGLEESPLTSGAITGVGPRYCPSLEQKVMHYPDRRSHLVYLEPDGLDTDEIYPGGISTSFPEHVQLTFLRTIPGLDQVELIRAGYAVEYDAIAGGQLGPGLELGCMRGLFSGGQINGSSGYEEAAAQGLIAGVNATQYVRGLPAWVPEREKCAIGVLCSDVSGGGFLEPYRILPSRVENRLVVREDNARFRLAETGMRLGLIPREVGLRWLEVKDRADFVAAKLAAVELTEIRGPNSRLEEMTGPGRPLEGVEPEVAEQVFLSTRYQPYVRQREIAEDRLQAEENRSIPSGFPFDRLIGLSAEAREALHRHRPRTVAEASTLHGVSREALAVLVSRLRLLGSGDVPRGTD